MTEGNWGELSLAALVVLLMLRDVLPMLIKRMNGSPAEETEIYRACLRIEFMQREALGTLTRIENAIARLAGGSSPSSTP